MNTSKRQEDNFRLLKKHIKFLSLSDMYARISMYELFCDGSAIHNPRCGGWGFVLRGIEEEIQCSGFQERRGINYMELMAVVEGLDRVPQSSTINIYTDSTHVIIGAKRHFNGPLWDRFFAHREQHQLKLIKVKNHPNHTKAHRLAREAAFNRVFTKKVRWEGVNCTEICEEN